MQPGVTSVERDGRAAVVHLHGDLVVPTARALYGTLRGVAKRRDVRTVVLDFSQAGRIDSSGAAVVSLIGRQLAHGGKQLELSRMQEQHRAALALVLDAAPPAATAPAATAPAATAPAAPAPETAVTLPGAPGVSEAIEATDAAAPAWVVRLGEHVLGLGAGARALASLAAQIIRQILAVTARRARLPAGALRYHIEVMGAGAIFIVALLSFLIGMTMAFQGAVQLQRFGAGVFVADLIGMSMVLVPLMTAVIITGRTGAAIAAELGTMQVRSEIDALATMGINPVRFLIVPRMLAITAIGPALTLIGIFVGILGGMLVAAVTLDLPPVAFWARVVERVTLLDFMHGLGKSLVFAWIIGLAGSHLGMRARGDASSVGTATTRTVVAAVFSIIVVDAIFATISTPGFRP
jgi:phospholipid/cholesterol/gamma-HCH transport system permease protein